METYTLKEWKNRKKKKDNESNAVKEYTLKEWTERNGTTASDIGPVAENTHGGSGRRRPDDIAPITTSKTQYDSFAPMTSEDVNNEIKKLEKEKEDYESKNSNKLVNWLSKIGTYILEGQTANDFSYKSQQVRRDIALSTRAENTKNIDTINDYTNKIEQLSLVRKEKATEELLGGLTEEQVEMLDNLVDHDNVTQSAHLTGMFTGNNTVYSDALVERDSINKKYRKPLFDQLKEQNPDMTDAEISERINNMIELRKNQRNAETQSQYSGEAKLLATEHPVSSFILSRGGNLVGGMAGLTELYYQMGNEYGLDTNAGGFAFQNTSNAIDEQIQLDHDWVIHTEAFGDIDGFDLAYNVGTAVVDNVARVAASGGNTFLASGYMFTQGTNQAIIEGKKKGYSDSKALTMGLLEGTFEALSEKISLDVILGDSGGNVLKHLAKSFVAEGTEETTSNWLNRIADEIANGNHSEMRKLYASYIEQGLTESQAMSEVIASIIGEDFESFVIGGLSGAVMGGGKAIVDATSNEVQFSENEQKVIDKVIENRIAEIETDDNKLTNKEKAEIEKQVKSDLEHGYIDIDTIESVLGGETYESYKSISDKENSLREEITKLESDPSAIAQNRLEEARTELEAIEKGTEKTELKDRLSFEVQELVKTDRLSESYNEKARRSQKFEADLSKYDEKAREIVKKAVESGILNNTNKTHEFVDLLAKLSAEKGVSFDFTNNENLKKSGFALEGVTVNGLVNGKDVILNVDSKKALNTVVGHEITHVLEGTDLYDELQSAIEQYATTKGEYKSRFEAISKLYDGRFEGTPEEIEEKLKRELTADLVGDYLFTDSDFINNLSTQKPNLFKKIYNEIKYLYKLATAGSKEARELEKVKRAFDKAYKQTVDTKTSSDDIEFSLSNKNITKNTDIHYTINNSYQNVAVNDYKSLTELQKKVRNIKRGTYENKATGYKADINATTIQKILNPTNAFNPWAANHNYVDNLNASLFLPELFENAVYIDSKPPQKAKNVGKQIKEFHHFVAPIEMNNGDYRVLITAREKVNSNTLYVVNAELLPNTKRSASVAGQKPTNMIGALRTISIADLVNGVKIYDYNLQQNKLYSDADIQYSLSEDVKKAEDYFGTTFNINEAGYLLTDGKLLDFSGKHEGAPGGDRTVDHRDIVDAFDGDYGDGSHGGGMVHFMQSGNIRLSPESGGINLAVKPTKEQLSALDRYISNFKGEVILDIDDANGNTVVSVAYPVRTHSKRIIDDINNYFDNGVIPEQPSMLGQFRYSLSEDSEGHTLSNEQKEYFKDSKIVDENGQLKVMYHGSPAQFTVFDKKKAKSSGYYGKGFYFSESESHAGQYGSQYEVYLNIKNPMQEGTNDITKEQLRKFVNAVAENEDYGIENYGYDATVDSVTDSVYGKDDFAMIMDINATSIGDMVEAIQLFNEINGTNYDGIIVPTETVAFYPEQIKSVTNQNPTDNPDINLSLSDKKDIAPTGNYNVYGKDIALETHENAPLVEEISPTEESTITTQDHIAIEPGNGENETISPELPKNESKMVRVSNKKMGEGGSGGQTPDIAPVARILTDEPTTEKKKNRFWNQAMELVLDKGFVFENLSKKTKNRELEAKWNFIRYADSQAQDFIGKGADGVKALNDIQNEVEDAGLTSVLYEYVYHLHNADRMSLANRYKNVENKAVFGDSVTAKVSQRIAAQLEANYPVLKKYANEIYSVNNYLRGLLVDGGVISQETADLWAEMYPHYVPIRRAGDHGLNINVPLDTGRTGVNAPIKKATGGNTDILPLFDTMAQRALQTYKAIAKNQFGVELKNTLGTTIGTEVADVDSVIDGIDQNEELLQKGKNGKKPTFTVFEGGEKVTFEITDDMYDALKPTSEALAYTNKLAKTISNTHRGVLTEYNPVFLASNIIKDVQDVLINSQHPAKTYANFPKAIKEMTKKGEWYSEYLKNGGEQNSYFDKQTNTFKKDKGKFVKAVGMPLNAISEANNFIERLPRLAEYIASREAGRSIEESMLDSARVTTNFAAGGDLTKFANRNGATFLNASIQGAMQQVRNVREAKMNGLKGWTQLATKYAIAGLPALLLNGLLWDDDDDYEELSDYVKKNYYIVAKYGDGKFVRIPKGRTLAVIQDAFNQTMNALTGDDEVDLKGFLDLAVSNLAPNNPLENNILSPIIQVSKNETWYGDDLVPTRLQDLPAYEQYDESTDAISKWLGEKLNYSPYKINYLLDQYTGGVGDTVLPMLTPEAESGDDSLVGNLMAPIKSKFTADSVMNNQNVSDFYETSEILTANAKMSNATDEDVLANKYVNSVKSQMSELYAEKREIQNSDLTNSEKYYLVREIQKKIDALAEKALDDHRNIMIDGSHATVGDRQYRLTDDGWTKLNDKQLEKQDEVSSSLGIAHSEYWSNKEEYDYAYESPGKYSIAKSIGGYDTYKTYSKELSDIKADKDENGKSISGSAKEKKAAYINGLNLDYGQKIILYRSLYDSKEDKEAYNADIVEYLDSREDISYEEMVNILEELDFKVYPDGTIEW